MATLKDVAKLAQVSTTTVSRILNGDPNLIVPDKTRDRVLRASLQMQYQVKARKREIGRRKLRRVGMIAFGNEQVERDDPYFLSIRRGVEQEFHKLGFDQSVVVQWSDTISSYNTFLDVDGVIVVGNNYEAADFFLGKSQKVVFVDRCPDISSFSSVVIDFASATYKVLDHLLSLGHKRIGYIGGIQNNGLEEDLRLLAMREHLGSKQMYFDEHIHVSQTWSVMGGYEMAKLAMASGNLADAYFIASDPMAIGAIRAWTESGIRVPHDVAIVGFDDIELAAYVTPPLTTVNIPTEIMGQMAANLLVDGIGDFDIPVALTVPTSLIIRESCGSRLTLNTRSDSP